MDDPIFVFGTLAIRLANAILWTRVTWKLARRAKPVPPLVRRLLCTVLFFGMWVLALGGTAPLGVIPGDVLRSAYTVFTAYAGLVAIGILTSDDPED